MGELTRAELIVDYSNEGIGQKVLMAYKGDAKDIIGLVETIEKEVGNFGEKSLYRNPINEVHTYRLNGSSYALVHPNSFKPQFAVKEGQLSNKESELLLKMNSIPCKTRSSYVSPQLYPNILTEEEREDSNLPNNFELLAHIVQKRLPIPEMYRKLPYYFFGEECVAPATNILFVGFEERDGKVDRYMCWTYLCDKHFKALDSATFGSEKNPIVHYKESLFADIANLFGNIPPEIKNILKPIEDTAVFGQKIARREGKIFPSRIHVCEDIDKLNIPTFEVPLIPSGRIPSYMSIMTWRSNISEMSVREVSEDKLP